MRQRLVCLGEILIDFLPIESQGEVRGFSLHPGGGPYNVAVGLARLGQTTAFVGKVGADFFGRRLRRAVQHEGIADDWLPTAPDAPTTLAFVAHEDGEPVFTFYGEGGADTLLSADDLPADLFTQTGLLHFGGISLLRGSTPAAALAAAEGLRGRALISLDPNVRPKLIRDAAAYRETLRRATAACDLLKVSAADVAWLAPDSDVESYALQQLEAGPAMALLTRGSEGAVALRRTPDGIERIATPGFAVSVVDTVGAGDSFTAGVLAAFADRGVFSREGLAALPSAEVQAALRYGAAVAAINCSRAGADPPRSAEVAAWLSSR